ncbi:flagellar basal body FlgE domain-containing protein [Buchnera aphidicola (Pseudoregma panicola)]|uniref:flagellar basal body FlgE domain-containing protein n=1 Tax=Buchnera aphidicola TaxID=9 RepID=UPI0031B6C80B
MLITNVTNNEKNKLNEKKIENKKQETNSLGNKTINFYDDSNEINKVMNDKDIKKNIVYVQRGKKLLGEIFDNFFNRKQATYYGLFRLIDKDGNVSVSAKRDFTMNSEFKIVNNDGKYLTGHLFDKVNDVNIPKNELKPEILDFSKKFLPIIRKTNQINIEANLNTEEEVKEEIKFNPLNPLTYTIKRSIPVYDNLGHHNDLDIYFLKNAVNSWRIISINKKNNERYDQNYIFYNRANNKIHIMGSGIIVKSDFNPSTKNKILFKCTDITTNKNKPTYFKKLKADGAPMKSLSHYDICPNGDVIGVFSDDTRGKLGFAEIIKFPEDVRKCLEEPSISNTNESLINFLKKVEFNENVKKTKN